MRAFSLLVAVVLISIGLGVVAERSLDNGSPATSASLSRIVEAVNTEGSGDHIGPAPNGARPEISASRAETLAIRNAPGVTVIGETLGTYTSLYPRAGVLSWVVAIDRPGPHLPPSLPAPVPGNKPITRSVVPYNYDVVFVSATSGRLLGETQGVSKLLLEQPAVSVKF